MTCKRPRCRQLRLTQHVPNVNARITTKTVAMAAVEAATARSSRSPLLWIRTFCHRCHPVHSVHSGLLQRRLLLPRRRRRLWLHLSCRVHAPNRLHLHLQPRLQQAQAKRPCPTMEQRKPLLPLQPQLLLLPLPLRALVRNHIRPSSPKVRWQVCQWVAVAVASLPIAHRLRCRVSSRRPVHRVSLRRVHPRPLLLRPRRLRVSARTSSRPFARMPRCSIRRNSTST